MCRFVTQRVIVHRSWKRRSWKRPRTKFVEFAVDQRGYPLSWIHRILSVTHRFDRSPRRAISREIEKKRILGESVTLKGNHLFNRDKFERRARFFLLSRIFFLQQEECFFHRRIVIRRPGRNDSANGTTLAVVSSPREDWWREREGGGKKKIITPFANPFRWKLLERIPSATRSRWKFILSPPIVRRARNYRAKLGRNVASCN